MYQAEGRYIQKTDRQTGREIHTVVKLMKYYLAYRASGYVYTNVTLTIAVGKVPR